MHVNIEVCIHVETLGRRCEKVNSCGIPSLPANHKISARQ